MVASHVKSRKFKHDLINFFCVNVSKIIADFIYLLKKFSVCKKRNSVRRNDNRQTFHSININLFLF